MLETYLRNCGDYRTELGHQLFVMSRLEQTAYKVRPCRMLAMCAFVVLAYQAIQAAGICDRTVSMQFVQFVQFAFILLVSVYGTTFLPPFRSPIS